MNRVGSYDKNFSGEAAYQSFHPAPLPPEPYIDISDDMLTLLVKANSSLARLDSASKYIPNADLFLSMYVRKEALISSQIEGTQCTLDDILDPNLDQNMNLDVTDVINYVKATQYALERMKSLPLCNRLLKETHAILMEGVRGQDKAPGEFRKTQNWIGSGNSTLNDARFIPPNVQTMLVALSDLEKYINDNGEYDALIQSALIHYQFETIHPFLDGNGRIGRLLVLLFLMDRGMLKKPILYVSYFLKKNHVEYYDRMSEIRKSGNFEQWIMFFLDAVNQAAIDALTSIERLNKLHQMNLSLLPVSTRKKDNVRVLFDYLQQHPIIDIGKTASELKITFNTVSVIVKKMMALGILKESTNSARNRVFVYEEYLQILRKDT